MKKIKILSLFLLIHFAFSMQLNAQLCDPTTPVHIVDLSGQPSGVWFSPNSPRAGQCCGATAPDICVRFIITLDSLANGIKFDIISGAVPPGALYYQIGCGAPVQVGQPLCLNGPGPHELTFCKPGNNSNVYAITSLPQPDVEAPEYVSQACTGVMSVIGLIDTSITWTSVPTNALYNSYLSCTSDCDTVVIQPNGGTIPPFVDYRVCGYVVGGCFPYFFCDTMRINFVNNLQVDITPLNPVICFGGPNIPITANITGGLAPYSFLWSTGETTQTIIVGPGTYYVELQDSLSCSIARDTLVVTGVPSLILADAGPDQLMCTNQQQVQLSGNVLTATGGIWSGGTGTFTPSRTSLNAVYTPSVSEINAGSVQLFLVTTGNFTCPADTDMVNIIISPSPIPSITGSLSVCAFSNHTYTAPLVSGITYSWSVTGGTIVNSNNNSINVNWLSAGTGTITLTEVNSLLCDSTVSIQVTINPQPTPVINGLTSVCTSYTTQYNVVNSAPGYSYNWTVTGGTISGSSNSSSVNVIWNVPGNGMITVTESNIYGCDSTVQLPVTILLLPQPSLSGMANGCAGQTLAYSTPFVAGNTYTWNVTGGTIVSSNNNSVTVSWPTATIGTVTLTEANTLTCDSTVSINVVIGPQPAPVIMGAVTVCASYNMQYSVANPVPGNTYSWTVTGGSITGSSINPVVNVTWNTAGSGTISVNESNSYGCDSTVMLPISILLMPAPVLSGTTSGCAGQTITYTTPLIANNTYAWNVTGGTIVSNNNNSITVSWPTAITGTVTLTEANTSTCDSTISINVIIGPQPVPVISGSATVCTSYNMQYAVMNPVAGNNYAWSITGGSIVGTSNNSTVNVIWNTPGTGTLTVYESNSYGCDSIASLVVNILQLPAPTLSGAANGCAGQNISYSTPLVSGNTYTWNIIGGTIISNNNNSITVFWPTATTGTVTLTEGNTLTCDSTISINVIIGPQPVPVINGSATVCTSYNMQYTVMNPLAVNSYAWSITGGTIVGASNNSTVNVIWNTPGSGTLTVYESNSYGCDSTASLTVSILQLPAPSISGAANGCAGQNISYSTPLVSGNTYAWNVTGGTVISNSNNSITVFWPTATTGTVTLTEANTLTCDSTVSLSVVVGPQPIPVIAGSSIVCTTTSTVYAVSNPVPGDTYVWTVAGGNINGPANTTSILVDWIVPGSGIVSVMQANSYGCDSLVSFPVDILILPTPSISGPLNMCAGHSTTYSVAHVTGNSYQWNVTGGTILNNNLNTITVQWPLSGIGTVTVTESNTLACDSTVTISISIGEQPAPALNGPTVVCTRDYASYIVTNFISGNIYSWTVTGGTYTLLPNGNGINVLWTLPGVHTITLNESNAANCDSTIKFMVDVRLKPAPVLSGPPLSCEASKEIYSVQSLPGHSYLWTVTGGSVVGTSVNNSIEVLWTTPGTGNVAVRVVSPLGCDSIVSQPVTVNPLPLPAISGPGIICEDETATFYTALAGTNTYNWIVTGATILGSSNTNFINVEFNHAGLVNILLTEMTALGCSRQVPFLVVVNDKPDVLISGSSIGCVSNQQYTFSTYSLANVSYQWSVNGGTILAGNGTSEITVQWLAPGNSSVSVTATNNITGCDSTFIVPVLTGVMQPPVINASSFAGCVPVSMNFSGNSNNSFYNYQWTFGDGSSINTPNPSHVYSNPGSYNVQLIATNNTGCADTATSIVEVYPNPVAAFNMWYGTDDYLISLSNLVLTNQSGGATTYLWDFGNGDTSTAFQPVYLYNVPGTYEITLIATNQYGCTDVTSQQLPVKVPEQIYIPNAFSPNNDNVNDGFSIEGLNITSLHISIFNRWGQVVYSSDSPSFKWDGLHNGKPAPEGVYVYSVAAEGFHGRDFKQQGTVTLVR